MTGPDIEDLEMQGIIPRMVRNVFNRIETAEESIVFEVKVSMVEIYNERVKDLLNPQHDNVQIRQDVKRGVYLQGVTESFIAQQDQVYEIMKLGNSNRSVGATKMNAESSRSHSLFQMTITQTNNEDLSVRAGKLVLVDLAGSEKISKTEAAGQTLEEAKKINQSLTK